MKKIFFCFFPYCKFRRGSTSKVRKISYETNKICFNTSDNQSEVVMPLASKPKSVKVSGKSRKKLSQPDGNRYVWKTLDKEGVLNLK
jgi:hypothetical protein